MLDPVARCFTADVARQVAALRADSKLQARLDALARKANEGELSEDEHEEYDAYVEALDLVSILQAKPNRSCEAALRPDGPCRTGLGMAARRKLLRVVKLNRRRPG